MADLAVRKLRADPRYATGGAGSSGWDLLALLLHPEWDQRPSAAEALAHPFFDAEMAIY